MSEYVYNDTVTQPEHSEVSAYMFLLNKQTNKQTKTLVLFLARVDLLFHKLGRKRENRRTSTDS